MEYKFKYHSDLAKGQKVPYISLLYLKNEKVKGEPIAFPLEWKDETNVFTEGEVSFAERDIVMIDDGQGAIIYQVLEDKFKLIGPLDFEKNPIDSYNIFLEAEKLLKERSYINIIMKELEEAHVCELAEKVAENSCLRNAQEDYRRKIDSLVTDVNLLLEAERIAHKKAEKYQARIKELETENEEKDTKIRELINKLEKGASIDI